MEIIMIGSAAIAGLASAYGMVKAMTSNLATKNDVKIVDNKVAATNEKLGKVEEKADENREEIDKKLDKEVIFRLIQNVKDDLGKHEERETERDKKLDKISYIVSKLDGWIEAQKNK